MSENLELPVEVNVLIQKSKEINIMTIALHLGLNLDQTSSIHLSGVVTLGLRNFSILNNKFTLEEIVKILVNSKAVGFSVLDHFLVDTEKNIPQEWGIDYLYGGDIFVNKQGIKFLVKISKFGERVQFIPIGEIHIFDLHDKLICLASNIV